LVLAELSSMADQMMKDKAELESLSSSKQATQREIDSLLRKTSDVKSLLEIEERSLQSTRARLMTAREETERWENACVTARAQADEEEMKLKHVKSVAIDQIKALQVDASKLQSDLKSSRRAVEDVDSNRRRIEEEAIKRRSDLDAQLLAASRDLEETLRRTSSLKAEGR
jgi:chromosome segregation ATPase